MMTDHPFLLSALLDREYYENIERYRPSAEYRDVVAKRLDETWRIEPEGFWTQCTPPDSPSLEHGWKIHVSTAYPRAIETLERIVPVLAEYRESFKFCSDPWMLRLSLSKNWSRSQAGKFVTVYPSSTERFKRLTRDLHRATRGLAGPHILTDRPYRGSEVVFYRYGEHRGLRRSTANGLQVSGFRSATGEWFDDRRAPYYRLPDWVEDPFDDAAPPDPETVGEVLLHDRYRVAGVLKFNAVGGIYEADDTATGERVVLREARPFLAPEAGGELDSFDLIAKEARILEKLGATGYAPRFVELFDEWKHRFLVQELLDAESLWGYSMNFYFRDDLTPADCFEALRATIRKIIAGLGSVHARGIVLRDLTKNNVLVDGDGDIRFIDFEFAYELDRDDPPIQGWTPGYASPDQLRNRTPTPSEDHYALGALVLDMIGYTASGYALNRRGILEALRRTLDDLGLPRVLFDLVRGLTALDAAERWDLERAEGALDEASAPRSDALLFPPADAPLTRPAPSPALRRALAETVDSIAEFLDHSADFDRTDRLWPASAQVFSTNPISFQYGATGTAFFLLRARGRVDDRIVDWIDRQVARRSLPPGLYSGLAGVAVFLLDAGRRERAREVFALADDPEQIHASPGIFYGAAGWGLAALHLWRGTGERVYLDRALEIAEHLRRTASENEYGVYWQRDAGVLLGFAEGQSGVATFLLLLHAASPDPLLLETAVRALDHDLAHGQEMPAGVAWYPRVESEASEPKSPHLWFGTAGMGLAAVRCWAATGEPRYRAHADRCAVGVSSRFTNKIWQDFGLSGFGELLLDLYAFTGEENYLRTAYYLAEALLPHRIERERGIGFAGEDLYRICCDYGAGAAGIGTFLHRLLHPQTPRLLLLDELFSTRRAAARGAQTLAVAV